MQDWLSGISSGKFPLEIFSWIFDIILVGKNSSEENFRMNFCVLLLLLYSGGPYKTEEMIRILDK